MNMVSTDNSLDLSAANGLEIPYERAVIVDIEMGGHQISSWSVIITCDFEDRSSKNRSPGVIGTIVLRFISEYAPILEHSAGTYRDSFVRIAG